MNLLRKYKLSRLVNVHYNEDEIVIIEKLTNVLSLLKIIENRIDGDIVLLDYEFMNRVVLSYSIHYKIMGINKDLFDALTYTKDFSFNFMQPDPRTFLKLFISEYYELDINYIVLSHLN